MSSDKKGFLTDRLKAAGLKNIINFVGEIIDEKVGNEEIKEWTKDVIEASKKRVDSHFGINIKDGNFLINKNNIKGTDTIKIGSTILPPPPAQQEEKEQIGSV